MNKIYCITFFVYYLLLSDATASKIEEYTRKQEIGHCITNNLCNVSNNENFKINKRCMINIENDENFISNIFIVGNMCSAEKATISSIEKIISDFIFFIKKISINYSIDLKPSEHFNVYILYTSGKGNLKNDNKKNINTGEAKKYKDVPVVMVNFKKDLFFDFNSSELKNHGRIIIQSFIHDIILSSPEYKIVTVIGHADNIGNEVSNFILSKRRSDATTLEIQKQIKNEGFPVNDFTIESVGVGETQPVENLPQETKSQANRRVEIFFSTSSSAMYNARRYIQCLYRDKSGYADCFDKYLAQ